MDGWTDGRMDGWKVDKWMVDDAKRAIEVTTLGSHWLVVWFHEKPQKKGQGTGRKWRRA